MMADMNGMPFATYLLRLARERNLALREVADAVDVSPAQLTIALDQECPPVVLDKLARFFDVSIIDMYTRAGLLPSRTEREFLHRMQDVLNDREELKRFLDLLITMEPAERKERIEKVEKIVAFIERLSE